MQPEIPEILEYALYPSPTAEHALGLLFCKLGEQRCTVIVEAEWLRTLIAGNTAGVDFRGFEVPAECALPGLIEGWPDDWPDDGPYPKGLDDLAGLLERMSFAQIREASVWISRAGGEI